MTHRCRRSCGLHDDRDIATQGGVGRYSEVNLIETYRSRGAALVENLGRNAADKYLDLGRKIASCRSRRAALAGRICPKACTPENQRVAGFGRVADCDRRKVPEGDNGRPRSRIVSRYNTEVARYNRNRDRSALAAENKCQRPISDGSRRRQNRRHLPRRCVIDQHIGCRASNRDGDRSPRQMIGKGRVVAWTRLAGPKLPPYITNTQPCASPELGKPGGRLLPALTTPVHVGFCAASVPAISAKQTNTWREVFTSPPFSRLLYHNFKRRELIWRGRYRISLILRRSNAFVRYPTLRCPRECRASWSALCPARRGPPFLLPAKFR